MAYSKQNFQNGQILNAANLEAMENGIIAGQGAKNLLVNSDFRNPIDIDNLIGIVNANPCFTRWNFDRASSSVTTQIIKIDNRIRVYKNGGVARFYQLTDYNLLNKTVSYAIGTSEGIFVGSCIVSTDSKFTQIGTHTGYISVYQNTEQQRSIFSIYFNNSSEDSIDLYWAALYEGAYTKETLPDYIPKSALEESLNSRVNLQPKNFIPNGNFINPINSKFQTTYTNNVSSSTTFYTIDKWELGRWSSDGSGTATLTVRSDGVLLSGGTSSNTTPNSCNLYQIINVNSNMQNKLFTAVLHTTVSIHDNVALFRIYDADTGDEFGSITIKTRYNIINFTIPSTCSRLAIAFGTHASLGGHGQVSIVAQYIALYEGKYTIENLPIYTPYPKQIEMLRCGIPTSPRNILKNSDFIHPLNTTGFKSKSSGDSVLIDGWSAWIAGNGGNIELTSSGIKLSPPSSENIGIRQNIENYELNKIHTIVVYINNTPYIKRFQMGNWGVGTAFGPIDFFSIPTANVLLRINSTHSAVTIQKVALYEGAYTIDTLPGYISNTKHVEMLNCNIPLAPHNLLDNSDFTNPVNQRGATSYTGEASKLTYTIDRWNTWATYAKTEVTASGLKMTGIDGTGYIAQLFEKPDKMVGKTYTLAAGMSNGTILCGTATVPSTTQTKEYYISAVVSSDTNPGLRLQVAGDLSRVRFQFAISNGKAFTVAWAALYEGAYTVETLPAYQPKGYAAELAECQRYYYQSWDGASFSNKGWITKEAISASSLALIEFPTEMRIVPTITFYTAANETGVVKEWTTSSSVSATQNYTSTKAFGVAGEGNFTTGKTYYFHYSASADL